MAETHGTNGAKNGRGKVRLSSTTWWWLALGAITLCAAIIRLWHLGGFPQQYNQDEMVLGFDAQSLWTTGSDQWGAFLPVYFRTFNDYVPPLGNYLDAPFVGTLGLTITATRLPFALLGIATIFMCGLLGEALFGRAAGLLAALFLTVEPWHVNYSRIAFPTSLQPFFIVTALYAFVRGCTALDGGKNRAAYGWLAGSGIAFGLLGMTYPVEKENAPILLGLCFAAAARLLWRHKRHLGLWIGAAALTASPAIYTQLTDWNTLQFRFNEVSIFDNTTAWWFALPRNFVSHYDPSALFFDGFRDGVSSRPDGVGELLWLEAIVMLWALVVLLRGHKIGSLDLRLLLLGWFATFPIAASLTMDAPHELRALNLLPLPELLAGYGAVLIWQALRGWQRNLAVAGGTLLFAVNAAVFLIGFFPPANAIYARDPHNIPTNIGLAPLAQAATKLLQPCDTLWFEPTNQAQIYYAFSIQMPPAQFKSAQKDIDAGSRGFTKYVSLGQVVFRTPTATAVPYLPKYPLPGCADRRTGHVYWLGHYADPGSDKMKSTGLKWRAIGSATNDTGAVMWGLYEKI